MLQAVAIDFEYRLEAIAIHKKTYLQIVQTFSMDCKLWLQIMRQTASYSYRLEAVAIDCKLQLQDVSWSSTSHAMAIVCKCIQLLQVINVNCNLQLQSLIQNRSYRCGRQALAIDSKLWVQTKCTDYISYNCKLQAAALQSLQTIRTTLSYRYRLPQTTSSSYRA